MDGGSMVVAPFLWLFVGAPRLKQTLFLQALSRGGGTAVLNIMTVSTQDLGSAADLAHRAHHIP